MVWQELVLVLDGAALPGGPPQLAATASDTDLVQESMVLCKHSPTKLFKTLQISQNIEAGSRWIIIFFNLEDFWTAMSSCKDSKLLQSSHPAEAVDIPEN